MNETLMDIKALPTFLSKLYFNGESVYQRG